MRFIIGDILREIIRGLWNWNADVKTTPSVLAQTISGSGRPPPFIGLDQIFIGGATESSGVFAHDEKSIDRNDENRAHAYAPAQPGGPVRLGIVFGHCLKQINCYICGNSSKFLLAIFSNQLFKPLLRTHMTDMKMRKMGHR